MEGGTNDVTSGKYITSIILPCKGYNHQLYYVILPLVTLVKNVGVFVENASKAYLNFHFTYTYVTYVHNTCPTHVHIYQ